jgi:hypothetical protein
MAKESPGRSGEKPSRSGRRNKKHDRPPLKYPMGTPTLARYWLALARRDYTSGRITDDQDAEVRQRLINR